MAQEAANKFIENVCNHLVRNMNITKVEEHFKETITMRDNQPQHLWTLGHVDD